MSTLLCPVFHKVLSMAKQAFTPIQPARRGSELLNAIARQLETVPPAVSNAPVAIADPPSVAPAEKPMPFMLRLSPAVFRAIDIRASEQGVTMTVVIARALQQAGFQVPDDDLKDRRKRRFRTS